MCVFGGRKFLGVCAMSQDFGPQSRSERHSKYHQKSILGGFSSFDGDSLPDYSEFDSESVTLDFIKER